tara:strand:+ start:143 stop:265 length:123 start_codon:yes stop_codon:yes gene_type:complete
VLVRHDNHFYAASLAGRTTMQELVDALKAHYLYYEASLQQ